MSESKPKRVITEEQKAKMKAALEAKRADPVWQEEQKAKRAAKKAAKEAEKASKKEAEKALKEAEKAAGGGDAPNNKDKPKRTVTCGNCHMIGHTKRSCPTKTKDESVNAGETTD